MSRGASSSSAPASRAAAACRRSARRASDWTDSSLVGEEPHPPYERPAPSKEFLAGTREELLLQERIPRSRGPTSRSTSNSGSGVERIGHERPPASARARRARTLVWDALVLAQEPGRGGRQRLSSVAAFRPLSSGRSTTRGDFACRARSRSAARRSSDWASSAPRLPRSPSSSESTWRSSTWRMPARPAGARHGGRPPPRQPLPGARCRPQARGWGRKLILRLRSDGTLRGLRLSHSERSSRATWSSWPWAPSPPAAEASAGPPRPDRHGREWPHAATERLRLW